MTVVLLCLTLAAGPCSTFGPCVQPFCCLNSFNPATRGALNRATSELLGLSQFGCLPSFPEPLLLCRFTSNLSLRRRPTRAQQSLRPLDSRPMGAWGSFSTRPGGSLVGFMYRAQLTMILFAALYGWRLPGFLLARYDGLLRRPSFVSVAACQPAAQPATASKGSQDPAPSELNLGKTSPARQAFSSSFRNVVAEHPWTNEAVPRLVSAV